MFTNKPDVEKVPDRRFPSPLLPAKAMPPSDGLPLRWGSSPRWRPLQVLEEFAGVADDLLVPVPAIGGTEGHHVDAGHIILQLHLGIFARDVSGLGVDQRLDVLKRAHRHGIIRTVPA